MRAGKFDVSLPGSLPELRHQLLKNADEAFACNQRAQCASLIELIYELLDLTLVEGDGLD